MSHSSHNLRRAKLFLFVCMLWWTSSHAQGGPLEQAVLRLQEVTSSEVRNHSTQDFGRAPNFKGRSVLVPDQAAGELLSRLRKNLPPGVVAFVGVTNNLATPKPAGVELVVAEGSSQFDILRVAATDGVNHGLKTEDLIRELESWDREFGIDIWHAETDVVQLRLKRLPKDLKAFAARVYKFCPDIVDQGVGSVRELEREIAKHKALLLWWD